MYRNEDMSRMFISELKVRHKEFFKDKIPTYGKIKELIKLIEDRRNRNGSYDLYLQCVPQFKYDLYEVYELIKDYRAIITCLEEFISKNIHLDELMSKLEDFPTYNVLQSNMVELQQRFGNHKFKFIKTNSKNDKNIEEVVNVLRLVDKEIVKLLLFFDFSANYIAKYTLGVSEGTSIEEHRVNLSIDKVLSIYVHFIMSTMIDIIDKFIEEVKNGEVNQ